MTAAGRHLLATESWCFRSSSEVLHTFLACQAVSGNDDDLAMSGAKRNQLLRIGGHRDVTYVVELRSLPC